MSLIPLLKKVLLLYNFTQSGNNEYCNILYTVLTVLMYFKNIGLCTNFNDPPDDGNVEVSKYVLG
jgi:hypothetical protein